MWKFFFSCLLISSVVSAQSVDELLREADLTLSGRKAAKDQTPPKGKKRPSQPATPSVSQSPAGTAEPSGPAEAKNQFNPTEAAQILKADLQAISQEQTKRDPRVDFSILGGQMTFSPSFALYKDDDTFRLEKTAVWSGATVETAPNWTLIRVGSFGFQGQIGGSLGFYSGNGIVNRTGIQSRVYEMQFMTVPLEIGAGLGVNWAERISLGFRLGPSLNVINQKGAGTQDTLSGVFGGDLLLTSLRVRVTPSLSLRADYRQQGVSNKTLISQAFLFGVTYNLH